MRFLGHFFRIIRILEVNGVFLGFVGLFWIYWIFGNSWFLGGFMIEIHEITLVYEIYDIFLRFMRFFVNLLDYLFEILARGAYLRDLCDFLELMEFWGYS